MKQFFVMVSVLSMCALVIFVLLAAELLKAPLPLQEERLYQVEKGATVRSVADDLFGGQSGTVAISLMPLVTELYARATASHGHIKAGEYQISPPMTPTELLELLRSGQVVSRDITFPEGWKFSQWRERLAQTLELTQQTTEMSVARIMSALGSEGQHPEGQFFPDTYHYVKGDSDLDVLRRAYRRMQTRVANEWQQRRIGFELSSPADALIIASIVEMETGYAPDRGRVARVFLNRVKKRMRLQADSTIIYGLGDDFDGDLKRHHLTDADNPYNSYVHRGLPPSPICSPGLASIRATLQAPPGDEIYFVARGDGTSEFSSTLEAHNQAVNKYQRGQN